MPRGSRGANAIATATTSPSRKLQRLRQRPDVPSLAAVLPALLVVFFGFRAGGFFVGTVAFAVCVLGVAISAYVVATRRPLADIGVAAYASLAGFGALAIWTLLSSSWSHAPARAETEFDRVLLYLAVIFITASIPYRVRTLRIAVRALAVACTVVCVAGLISRLLPHVIPTAASLANDRLSYPITYWNALGLLGALGAILCLHLTCDADEPKWVRVGAAGLLPLLSATVFFTFSRGAMAVAVIAIVVYLVAGRPRGMVGGVLAGGAASAVAILFSQRADALTSITPTTPEAVRQGTALTSVLIVCVLGAAAARALLLRLDPRAATFARANRRALSGALAAAAVIAVVAAVALGAPGALADGYRGFVKGDTVVGTGGSLTSRLASTGNNGRLDLWDVALDSFTAAPLTGNGAGTFQNLWAQNRTGSRTAVDGHSLYLEVLGELGVPGLAFVLLGTLALLVGTAARVRGRHKAPHAAIGAVLLAWMLHAGLDWDWEMPVVTVVPLALGGLAVARRRNAGAPATSSLHPAVRIVAGLGCLVLLVTPATIGLSQARLNASVNSFHRGDCRGTIDSALGAIDAASTRPEPFELLALCDARLGLGERAQVALNRAMQRDRDSWEYHYSMAVVRAHFGIDPRPDARAAVRLNPHEPLTMTAAKSLDTGSRARWQEFASRAQLPVP